MTYPRYLEDWFSWIWFKHISLKWPLQKNGKVTLKCIVYVNVEWTEILLSSEWILFVKIYSSFIVSASSQLLWKQAHSYPLFHLLMEIDSYMFSCVNQTAVREELEDETRRLCDVRPFLPVLQLITRSCDPGEKLDSKIGVLIGKGRYQ